MLLKYLFVSICALLLIKIIHIFAVKIDLVDKPNIRKKHFFKVPLVGGLVFAFANLIIYSINDFSFSINKILVVSTIVAIIGFFDDKFELSVTKKIILLIIPIFITATDDLILTGFGNYKYFNDINFGSYAIICTVGAALLLVNATNYFDGSDGNLLTMFINSLIILIPFNLSIQKKIKIFPGNAGSLLVGFLLSFCLIYSAEKYKIHPIILSFSVSVIIFDFLSVTIVRLIKGKNIFLPDNSHIHHLLIKFFNSNIMSLIILNLINLTLFAISLVFYHYINSLSSLLLFIFSFILFFFFRFYLTKYV
jgi:UDP-GlcNAc:undecaprenyl-phosphate GlcNAc-1-phosphate transferase